MNTSTDRPRTLLSMAPSVYLPAMVFEIGNGAVTPVIAITALDLGASAGTAGLLVALLGIGQLAGDVPAGALAARLGDRRAMVAAGGVSMVAMLGCLLTPSLPVFGLCLFAMGVVHRDVLPGPPVLPHRGGAGAPAGAGAVDARRGAPDRAVHRAVRGRRRDQPDVVARRVRRRRRHGRAGRRAAARDPGRRTPGRRRRAAPESGAVGLVATVRTYRRLLLTLGVAVLAIGAARAARQVVLPLWAVHIGLSPEVTSLVFGVASAVDMALFYPSGKVMDRHGRLAVAVPSMLVLGAAMAVLPLTGGAGGAHRGGHGR